MFDALAPYHPQIVHTPIALLIFSAFFAIVGRVMDREWVRKTSVLLLVFGFLGAFFAYNTGVATHEIPEQKQGVPEHEIDEHGDMGRNAMLLAGGALLVMAIGTRLSGGAANAVGTLALLLQIGAAVAVGLAGKRGGELVFEYGANVHLGGKLVQNPSLPAGARDADEQSEAKGEAGEKR